TRNWRTGNVCHDRPPSVVGRPAALIGPTRKAPAKCAKVLGNAPLRDPIRQAHASSGGHVADARPPSVMNSRGFNWSNGIRRPVTRGPLVEYRIGEDRSGGDGTISSLSAVGAHGRCRTLSSMSAPPSAFISLSSSQPNVPTPTTGDEGDHHAANNVIGPCGVGRVFALDLASRAWRVGDAGRVPGRDRG